MATSPDCTGAGCAPARVFQSGVQIEPRHPQRWQKTEHSSGEQRKKKRKEEGSFIDTDVVDPGNAVRTKDTDPMQTPKGEQNTNDSSRHGQQHAFGKHLTHNSGATRTHSCANG